MVDVRAPMSFIFVSRFRSLVTPGVLYCAICAFTRRPHGVRTATIRRPHDVRTASARHVRCDYKYAAVCQKPSADGCIVTQVFRNVMPKKTSSTRGRGAVGPWGRGAVGSWAVGAWGHGAVGPWGRGAVGPWGRGAVGASEVEQSSLSHSIQHQRQLLLTISLFRTGVILFNFCIV